VAPRAHPEVEGLETRALPSAVTQAFVNQTFQSLLGHGADPAAVTALGNALDLGFIKPAQVVQMVTESLEHRVDVVQNLFQTLLNRPADPGAINAFVSFQAQGGTVQQLGTIIMGSPEFTADHGGTPAGFVQAVFSNVLHRGVDPGALQFFSQQLQNGVSPTQVAAEVVNSLEAQQIAIAQAAAGATITLGKALTRQETTTTTTTTATTTSASGTTASNTNSSNHTSSNTNSSNHTSSNTNASGGQNSSASTGADLTTVSSNNQTGSGGHD